MTTKHLHQRQTKYPVVDIVNCLLLVVNDLPRSISAPLEKRSLRPTRSQGDADETVLCLQPDLPLARKLSSPSIKCVENKQMCV